MRFRASGLTVSQILSLLEENPPAQPTDIVILPPDEDNAVSDEDSDDEDSGPKDPNHVGFRLMNQQAELETHNASEDEIDVWLEDRNSTGERRGAQVDAVLGDTLAVPGPSTSNPTRRNPMRGTLQKEESVTTHRQTETMVSDPLSPSLPSPPSSSRKGRGRPRKRPVDEESASSEEEEVMEPREKLPRVKNVDRSQRRTTVAISGNVFQISHRLAITSGTRFPLTSTR